MLSMLKGPLVDPYSTIQERTSTYIVFIWLDPAQRCLVEKIPLHKQKFSLIWAIISRKESKSSLFVRFELLTVNS